MPSEPIPVKTTDVYPLEIDWSNNLPPGETVASVVVTVSDTSDDSDVTGTILVGGSASVVVATNRGKAKFQNFAVNKRYKVTWVFTFSGGTKLTEETILES